MGIWAILTLIMATCSTFVTWFSTAVTKFVAENVSKNSKLTAAAAFYQALRANIITYLPVIIGMYLGATFLASHLLGNASYAPLFRLLAFDVFLSAGMLQVVIAALLGLRMFRETAIVGLVVGGLLRQLLIILLIIVMKNFVGLVIGWLVSDVVWVGILLVIVIRALGAPRFDFPLVKLLRYYFPIELANIVIFAQTWFDRAILVVYVSLAILGIYNAAVVAFGVLSAVAAATSNMLFPAYSSIQEKTEGRESMRGAVRLATRYVTFTLTPLGFGLLATAKPAITLLVGEAYVGGYLPLVIFSGAFAVTAFTTALGPVFLALEETKTSASIACVTTVTSLAAAYMLLPKWGIEGAAAARALAIILGAILAFLVLKRKIGLQLDFNMIAKTILSGATMAAALFVVQLARYSKFLLPLYVMVGGIVYIMMLRLLKTVDSSDLKLLNDFFGRRLSLFARILSWMLLAD
jgi:O-antigen/teichoic acid export membrane protein